MCHILGCEVSDVAVPCSARRLPRTASAALLSSRLLQADFKNSKADLSEWFSLPPGTHISLNLHSHEVREGEAQPCASPQCVL